jgi:hypothetical protein
MSNTERVFYVLTWFLIFAFAIVSHIATFLCLLSVAKR